MKNFIINLICTFVPIKIWRKRLRALLKNETFVQPKAPIYKNIYTPYYNKYSPLDGTEPEIYNKDGQRVRVCFLRDQQNAHMPPQTSNYLLWDKFNFELPIHFYSHKAMLETMGSPQKRYGLLIETQGIVPDDYKIFETHKGLNKDFDLIFTYDEDILNKYLNARFVPFCAGVKLDFSKLTTDLNISKKLISDDCYKNKTKNVSILSSDKEFCDLHKVRIETAKKMKRLALADTFGTFDGGKYIRAIDTLKDYRYSIAFENIVSPYCFTEKLTNCFATQTIPIYIGATKINEFFNTDGIIQIPLNKIDDIEKIIKKCNVEDYNDKLEAIKDNYNRVKEYFNMEDYMYKNYLEKDFNK